MKSSFTLLLILFTFFAQAQKIIVDPVNIVENFEGVDVSDNSLDLETHISVTNNTIDPLQLIWTRIVTEDCPAEWDTQICDNNLCYFYTIDTNVSTETGLDAPFVLAGNESFDGFILHVLPRQVPGCCRVKVEFATVEEPELVLETAVFDISVNTENCDFTSSVEQVQEAQLVNVFPNPTQDAFTLSNNDVVKQIDLYNNIGQKLKSFNFENGQYYDVAELNPGIYSLVLKNEEGLTLNTLMLSRN